MTSCSRTLYQRKSSLSPGQASRSAGATRETRPQTWPRAPGRTWSANLKAHDYRHSHATWLDAAERSKVIQMDRRGHAMQGMDRVYMRVTPQMRQRLCDVLEGLWQDAVAERYKINAH